MQVFGLELKLRNHQTPGMGRQKMKYAEDVEEGVLPYTTRRISWSELVRRKRLRKGRQKRRKKWEGGHEG